MLPHFSDRGLSATAYIEGTHMDRNGTWGSDVDILTLAHMLNTCVYVYDIAVGIGMDPTMLIGLLVPIYQTFLCSLDTHHIILMLCAQLRS